MFREISRIVLAALLISSVSSCGGGGSSEGGSSPSNPTPTPSTPSTTFSAVALGPLLANVWFDTNRNGQFDSDDAVTATSMTGLFGRDVPPPQTALVQGTIPATPTRRIRANGVDATTGLFFSGMTAPAGATVVSPLSSLIDVQGTQTTVRNALGLASGTAALRSETDLLTFNPVDGLRSNNALIAEDAARIMSVNLQLLALAAVTRDTNGAEIDESVPIEEMTGYVTRIINETGSVRLSDKAVVLSILKMSRLAVGSPEGQLDAIAELLSKFFRAMPDRLPDNRAIIGWSYAYRFYVLPEYALLTRQWPNQSAARITALSETDIKNAAEFFASATPPAMKDFVAVTDFRELGPLNTQPNMLTLSGCGVLFRPAPYCNDVTLFSGMGRSGTITSVSTGDPTALSVALTPEGDVVVSRIGAFTGLTYFTYDVRSATEGYTSSGIVYVRVRETP